MFLGCVTRLSCLHDGWTGLNLNPKRGTQRRRISSTSLPSRIRTVHTVAHGRICLKNLYRLYWGITEGAGEKERKAWKKRKGLLRGSTEEAVEIEGKVQEAVESEKEKRRQTKMNDHKEGDKLWKVAEDCEKASGEKALEKLLLLLGNVR
jgi:hypothetical protein